MVQTSTIQKYDSEIEEEAQDTDDDNISMGIDHILETIVGGGGWGQWIVVLAIYPIGICSGIPLLLHMFAAFEPTHR